MSKLQPVELTQMYITVALIKLKNNPDKASKSCYVNMLNKLCFVPSVVQGYKSWQQQCDLKPQVDLLQGIITDNSWHYVQYISNRTSPLWNVYSQSEMTSFYSTVIAASVPNDTYSDAQKCQILLATMIRHQSAFSLPSLIFSQRVQHQLSSRTTLHSWCSYWPYTYCFTLEMLPH